MDLQKILIDSVATSRSESFKTSNQLTLGEMILKLEHVIERVKIEEEPEYKDADIKFNFFDIYPTFLDSWRGIYAELAICYSMDKNPPKAKEFLMELKSAIGKTFTGWKGGEYVMGKNTPIWVANPGNSGDTGVIDVIYDGYYVIIQTGKCKY